MRPSERLPHILRPVTIETGVNRYAEGSCLISFGHTRVLVTASVEEGVPPFLREPLRALHSPRRPHSGPALEPAELTDERLAG